MAQRTPLRIAAAAIASIAWTAAAAHAESDLAKGPSELEAGYNALFLPQLFEPERPHTGRPFKKNTVFQFDAEFLDGDADLLFRVQAKPKKFLYLKVRF